MKATQPVSMTRRVVMTQRVVMTTVRLTARPPRAFALMVVAVGVLGAAGLFADGGRWATVAHVIAGAAAAAVCLVTAIASRRAARRWRLLLGVGLAGWTVGRTAWWVHDLMAPGEVPAFSPANAGLFALPVCALLALLTVAGALPPTPTLSPPRDRIELVLDSVLVTGSLIALTWSSVLGEVTSSGARRTPAITAAVALPMAELLLAIMVLLLLTTRPAARSMRRPLLLAGLGLTAFVVADGLRAATTALAGPEQSPSAVSSSLAGAGYVLGTALLALAALSPPADADQMAAERPDADWLHLLLPYAPVIATGVVIAVRTGTGGLLTPFEAYLGWGGLGLVVARQMFTIVDNTVLLARISEGRQRLQHQAYHDPLTGLANRALFRERLLMALDDHRHRGHPMALLFADLDDFKAVNDGFGHVVGDRLLRAVAERLTACVRRGDLVARLGGDEFAVLLERRNGDAEPVGQRILSVLREPFVIDGQVLTVSASVGLVVPELADETMSADALLRRADAAMYAGKRRGKGALVRYAAGAVDVVHADLPHRLAQALAGPPDAAGFAVHYQPIVRFSDGVTVAVEALARWTDPVVGVVDPEAFVTVAERTGLVAAIDDFVLDRACADTAALERAFGRPVDVHVNVSAARLTAGLEETVRRTLQRHAMPATRLVVEITETRRIPDLTRAAAVTGRLRELGVRVALDDFGSGFNALAQLHALPVDIVKLDSTLTDVEASPERAGALCRSVLTICAGMGIEVVAEGVESTDRAVALAALGCPLGQGYLFGQAEPVPPPTVREDRPVAPRKSVASAPRDGSGAEAVLPT